MVGWRSSDFGGALSTSRSSQAMAIDMVTTPALCLQGRWHSENQTPDPDFLLVITPRCPHLGDTESTLNCGNDPSLVHLLLRVPERSPLNKNLSMALDCSKLFYGSPLPPRLSVGSLTRHELLSADFSCLFLTSPYLNTNSRTPSSLQAHTSCPVSCPPWLCSCCSFCLGTFVVSSTLIPTP